MKPIINKNNFLTIFKKKSYRRKLDAMILELFDLEQMKLSKSAIKKSDTLIEIVVLLNSIELFKIVLVDTQYFKNSRTFYLNISYKKSLRPFRFLLTSFMEIYCALCYYRPPKQKNFLIFCGIFYAKSLKKVKKILQKTEVFSAFEIEKFLTCLKEEVRKPK